MNRAISFLFIMFFVVILPAVGCGKRSVPQQSAVRAEHVLTALHDMVHDYEKKDLDGFMSRFNKNFHDRQALSASIATVFAKYVTIRFTVAEKKMLILVDDKGLTRVDFTWDAEWQTKEGIVQKDGGRAAFVFVPGQNTLLSIEGKIPFVPQPQAIPGK